MGNKHGASSGLAEWEDVQSDPFEDRDVTFKVKDVAAEDKLKLNTFPLSDFLLFGEDVLSSECSFPLPEDPRDEGEIMALSSINDFLRTALVAYNQHLHLYIAPDDVWLMIMSSLSFWMNKNSSEVRGKMVKHDGKKPLEVLLEEEILPGENAQDVTSWTKVVEELTEKIEEKILTKDFKSWIVPNFSTTTDASRIAGLISMMDMNKEYFSYKIHTFCGLPRVTLKGTKTDWVNVRRRIKRIPKLFPALANWTKVMDKVLHRFVGAYSGVVDVNFWNSIINEPKLESGKDEITGWLLAFAPFDEEGNYLLVEPHVADKTGFYGKGPKYNMIPSKVKVPVEIHFGISEAVPHELVGGVVGSCVDHNNKSIGNICGWALRVKKI